jgi:molybdopterin converting factor subunit 1
MEKETQIEINVKFFAGPREALGRTETDLTIPDGAEVQDLLDILTDRYPILAPYMATLSVAVNRAYVDRGTELRDGDEVACLPPVAGG